MEADHVAVSLFGSKNLISALIKVQIMNIIWHEIIELEVLKIKKNQTINNISFACSYVFNTQLQNYLSKLNLNANIPHLLDTHPTINERAKKLDVSLNEIYNSLATQDENIFFDNLNTNEKQYYNEKEEEISNEIANTLATILSQSAQSENSKTENE